MSEDHINHGIQGKPNRIDSKLHFKYQCHICQKYCKTEYFLKIHLRCHISSKSGPYRCHLCHFTFTKRHVLSCHLRQAHLSKLREYQSYDAKVPHCKCCKQKFSTLLDLKRHLTPMLSRMLQSPDDVPSSSLSVTSSIISSESLSSSSMRIATANSNSDNDNQCGSSKSKIKDTQCQQINHGKVSMISSNPERIWQWSTMRQKSTNVLMSKVQANTRKLSDINTNARVSSETQAVCCSSNNELYPEIATSITTDSDSSLGDNEFVSLLHSLFEEDSSEEESDSCDLHSLRNSELSSEYFSILPDRQKMHSNNLIESNPGFAKIDLSEHLDNEMMRRFLLSYSFIDRSIGVFKCLPCRSKFSSHAKLLDHFHFHFCLICGTSFQQKYKLSQHLKEHKNQRQSKEICNMKYNSSFIRDMFEMFTEISDDNKTFTCKMCCKDFSQQSNFFIHMYSHAKNQPSNLPSVVPVMKKPQIQIVDKDTSPNRQRKHPCPQCGKSFFSRNNLRGHMETHEQTQRFLCSICGKSFRRKRALFKHLNIHAERGDEREVSLLKQKMRINMRPKFASKEKPAEKYEQQLTSASGQFVVAACFTPQKLVPEKVKKQEDKRERSFSCSVCKKQFFSKRNLRGHMDVHNPDKSFSCSICSRSFRRKSTLKRHFITHTKTL